MSDLTSSTKPPDKVAVPPLRDPDGACDRESASLFDRGHVQSEKSGIHPVKRDSAIVPTRALELAVNYTRSVSENLLPGGVIYGRPRIGKTQAIRFMIANSEKLLGEGMPTSMLSPSQALPSNITENRFFSAMLDAVGYGDSQSGTAARKRKRVLDYMVDRTRSANEYRYILFIDEAQWLADEQLGFLVDLHNQLKVADVRLIVMLVGQPELKERKIHLRSAGKTQLLGRFMTSMHYFQGVVDQADFMRVCRSFDLQSEWPTGSGISFTNFFVPKAFGAGWRLEAVGTRIWEDIDAMRSRRGLPTRGELSMQSCIALIRSLLQRLNAHDAIELGLPEEALDASLKLAEEQIVDYLESLKAESPGSDESERR